MKKNVITRRSIIQYAAGAGLVALPGLSEAVLLLTPKQTAGPFYPDEADRFKDTDNDLVKRAGETKQAGGQVLHLLGVVQSRSGVPVSNALVEIWQCDVNGRYLHTADRSDNAKRDKFFQGYGTMLSESGGEYYFRTIKPVPYGSRTPHIHFKVYTGNGKSSLITQLYLAGEPLNQWDGLYRRLSEDQRRAVTADLDVINEDEFIGRFDIVVDT